MTQAAEETAAEASDDWYQSLWVVKTDGFASWRTLIMKVSWSSVEAEEAAERKRKKKKRAI